MFKFSRRFSTTASKFSTAAAIKPHMNAKPPKMHQLESLTQDKSSAVSLRRQHLMRLNPMNTKHLQHLPHEGSDFKHYDFYEQVHGVNCENVVGFLPIPVGVAGPLPLDKAENLYVPLATTEGALIASINRGMTAMTKSGGCSSAIFRDGMTRAPVVELPSVQAAAEFKKAVESEEAVEQFKSMFAETTNFGQLNGVRCTVAGRLVYMRFRATTGDAMGMNMVGKGVNHVVQTMTKGWGGFSPKLVALSSNVCTDKKASAINWIEGRGKSVVCEATIPAKILKQVLHVDIDALIKVHTAKNLLGSSVAGSLGGNNAHASNIVTAVFLATGQDPAQNIESSSCLLHMEKVQVDGEDSLNISVTMPSIEVGTVGGGTSLPAQKSCLGMLGVDGASSINPGDNSKQLAKVVAATVLAGELSLNAALASDQLISAHMKLNRKHETPASKPKTTVESVIVADYDFSKFKGIKGQKRSHGSMARIADMYHEYHDQFLDNRLPVP